MFNAFTNLLVRKKIVKMLRLDLFDQLLVVIDKYLDLVDGVECGQ